MTRSYLVLCRPHTRRDSLRISALFAPLRLKEEILAPENTASSFSPTEGGHGCIEDALHIGRTGAASLRKCAQWYRLIAEHAPVAVFPDLDGDGKLEAIGPATKWQLAEGE